MGGRGEEGFGVAAQSLGRQGQESGKVEQKGWGVCWEGREEERRELKKKKKKKVMGVMKLTLLKLNCSSPGN